MSYKQINILLLLCTGRHIQVSNQLNLCFTFQILSVHWQRNQLKMRANFIHFLCICTFLHGPPLLEAQSIKLEEEEESSSLQTTLMEEELLLLTEKFAAISQTFSDHLIFLNKLFKKIRKSFASHHILHIDVFACFEKPAPTDIPYCTEGWLIIQRRMDGSVDFYRGWSDYRQGFGNPSGEFWIGLETMHSLTQKRTYTLRIDLEDFEGKTRYAEYSTFAISDEAHGYTLSIGTYNGTAGDALTFHKNKPFLTKDNIGTGSSARCIEKYKGAWWYNVCHHSNLNGKYLGGDHTSHADGVNWYQWKGHQYSLKTTIMMIKPVD